MPTTTIPDDLARAMSSPCSCWRLIYPLGPDDALPDHVCTWTMLASVLQWQFEQKGPLQGNTKDWPVPHDGRSLMLALRARGVGSAWTTLHLRYEQDAATLLGIPDGIRQAALLPVAYYTGYDFKPAKRVPARERTYWNGWGQTR